MIDYRLQMNPNKFYHVYNRGNNGENLFKSDINYYFFLRRCKEILPESMDVFAWCFLPNHFHLLVKIKENGKPSASFQRLFTSYSKAINKQEGRHGGLFEKPFRRLEVNDENYLKRLVVYIHNNPVHHGFTQKIEQWKYSSYHDFINNKNDLIKISEVFSWFDDYSNFCFAHSKNSDLNSDLTIE